MSLSERHRESFDEDLTSKYEIIDVLGGGGMGRVLRARHRQLKRLVAIKLLQQDLTASDAVTRFLREARAAAQIRSPHIAQVMDAGILRNGQPYIVMEYLQGRDLSQLLATSGQLSVQDAVGFILQAIEAIAEAHSLDIIHRDIKPSNLFATRIAGGDTCIKVLDFGLAKTSLRLDTLDPSVTEKGAVLGTPSYMSPEQFVDAQDVDVRADVWGVGATLFELVTGTPPFRGTNLAQVYTAVMHRPIPSIRSLLPDLPAALESVIATCLTRARAERYANLAELASALAPLARASDREHVERIRRVIEAPTEPEHELVPHVVPPVDGADEHAKIAISSTFARPSTMSAAAFSRNPRSQPFSRQVRSLAISALLCGAAVLLWSFTTHKPLTLVPAASSAPPAPIAPRSSPAVPSEPAPTENASDVGPPNALKAQVTPTVPPSSTPALAPTPTKGVTQTGSKRPHKRLPSPPLRQTKPATSVYDIYP